MAEGSILADSNRFQSHTGKYVLFDLNQVFFFYYILLSVGGIKIKKQTCSDLHKSFVFSSLKNYE